MPEAVIKYVNAFLYYNIQQKSVQYFFEILYKLYYFANTNPALCNNIIIYFFPHLLHMLLFSKKILFFSENILTTSIKCDIIMS